MGLPRADMKETYFRFNQLCMTVSERDGYNRVGHPDDCVGPWVIEIPRTVSGIHCTLRAHMTKETTKLALHLGAIPHLNTPFPLSKVGARSAVIAHVLCCEIPTSKSILWMAGAYPQQKYLESD